MFMGADPATVKAAATLLLATSEHDDPLKVAQGYLLDVAYEADLVHVSQPTSQATPRRQVTRQVQRTVWDRDGWKCRACGDHRELTVDHITPLAKGGSMTDLGNLQTLCMRCNRKKGVN